MFLENVEGFNVEGFIGLSLDEVKKLAESKNMKIRVAKQDKKAFFLTFDFLTNRINLYMENGKVIQAGIG